MLINPGLVIGFTGSHWEKRLLMNEIMTGSVDTRSVVSKMTLALLEDSGWYKANYSMADQLDWGRNQGTEFVTSPCSLWKGAYRCNTTQFSGCTYNREAEGYCPILTYSGDLPQWARYFPQANKEPRGYLVRSGREVRAKVSKMSSWCAQGKELSEATYLLYSMLILSIVGLTRKNKSGQSSLADYCTYFVAYSDGSCTDTSSARAPDSMLGEIRGSNSRCMASSLVRTGFVRGSLTQGNGCYQHRCINTSLEVAVDGVWKVCPQAGGSIQFPGFNGQYLLWLCLGNVPVHVISMEIVLMEGVTAFLDFMVMIAVDVPVPAIALAMACASPVEYVNVKLAILALTVPLCSLHGGVCDNGVCEFRCSDYAGYTCQNSSMLLSTLSICRNVLGNDVSGQHCAPSESSILQQLEEVVVMPNYHRLFPGGARKLFNIFGSTYCDEAAKRLACWISIQKCEKDGDNRLRVCHSACQAYNLACGASLDCSDQTLFSSEGEGEGQCTGSGEMKLSWFNRLRNFSFRNSSSKVISVRYKQL
ncbi:unnamed protein product [Sphenostylis stenocarpa]|uniref:Leishmanolysin-like peptidase n=1 Tax=Sphenostylis stenocarpa TaxID=92480 RepID=A0AA86TME6_9FABA|nr:unnamed protein product [Sphenostylis stenocarpa]